MPPTATYTTGVTQDDTQLATLEWAKAEALRLMPEHGLIPVWTFGFDRTVGRFGRCDFLHWRISLSAPVVVINTRAEVRNTILHEIAHALVGPGHGHGPVWKRMCRVVGARPEACATAAVAPPRRWGVFCVDCGEVVGSRHRRSVDLATRIHSGCPRGYRVGQLTWRDLTAS